MLFTFYTELEVQTAVVKSRHWTRYAEPRLLITFYSIVMRHKQLARKTRKKKDLLVLHRPLLNYAVINKQTKNNAHKRTRGKRREKIMATV